MILTLSFSLAACGTSSKDKNTAKQETTGTTGTTATAGDAAKLFDQKCSSCHGGNLEGNIGPNLQKVGSKYNKDEILNIINKGKGGMPPGVIKGTDADAVATWLSGKK
ncbi:cytochrome c551 [Heyndrickxia sp. NPDC080065]|uniref:cytochrome c551 n=1 Tax=Heyndrickxia sp. NPDC080065 TaxID=3390568 RepID=UPI003D066F17